MKCITFGSHGNYIDAGKRLVRQALSLFLFSQTILYTAEYLKQDKEYWNQHSLFTETHKRGYGYWLWKPYIIKKTIETMKDGDVLLYLDCGCELDSSRKAELIHCIQLVKKYKIIDTTTHIEKDWTKMDLIKKINIKPHYLNTPQRQAGALLFLVCKETRQLVNQWYELGCDYHNIDDSPSLLKNMDCFIEHRHDQSIFSLLMKKYEFVHNYSLHKAVHYARNKSGVSKLL